MLFVCFKAYASRYQAIQTARFNFFKKPLRSLQLRTCGLKKKDAFESSISTISLEITYNT